MQQNGLYLDFKTILYIPYWDGQESLKDQAGDFILMV